MPGQQDSWGIQQNIMAAMALALEVWSAGGAAVCPHANTFCYQNSLPDEVWLEGDLAILARCEAVLTLPTWERSQGARAEVKFAEERGIPVFGTVAELERWMFERDVEGAA
jgi:hypothetical protein